MAAAVILQCEDAVCLVNVILCQRCGRLVLLSFCCLCSESAAEVGIAGPEQRCGQADG